MEFWRRSNREGANLPQDDLTRSRARLNRMRRNSPPKILTGKRGVAGLSSKEARVPRRTCRLSIGPKLESLPKSGNLVSTIKDGGSRAPPCSMPLSVRFGTDSAMTPRGFDLSTLCVRQASCARRGRRWRMGLPAPARPLQLAALEALSALAENAQSVSRNGSRAGIDTTRIAVSLCECAGARARRGRD